MKKIVPLIIVAVLVIGIGAFAAINYTPTTQQPTQTPEQPIQPQQPTPTQPQTKSTGKIAFVTAENIHIVNPDGTGEIRLTKGEKPLWSPDGKKIAFLISRLKSDTKHETIYIVNTDGTGETKVFECRPTDLANTGITFYSWSPDSKKILLGELRMEGRWSDEEIYKESGIYLANIDGSNLVKLADGLIADGAFSPDGKKIAYLLSVDKAGEYYNLYVMNSDGSGKTKLTDDKLAAWGKERNQLAWSPDGKKIAYADFGYDDLYLYVVDADGTNKIMLSETGAAPAWSPSGEKIAYRSFEGIYISNPDGTNKIQISGQKSYERISPSWSPDGKRITFGVGNPLAPSGISNVYVVNADGTELKRLVYGSYPQWSPAQN